MRLPISFSSLTVIALLATGCASQEEPARAALIATEASLDEVREDAAKFTPDELKAAEAKLAALKDAAEKEHYTSVLTGTSELNKELAFLKETVVSKKTQNAAAANEWTDLSTEVPQLVSALQNRVDTLSGSRKLPAEVTKDTFEAAKTALDSLKAMWADANAAFNAGNATEAADKGRLVKAKGEELRQQLAMPVA